FLGGFFLIPLLGIQRTIGAAVLLLAGGGLALLVLDRAVGRRARALAAGGAVFLALEGLIAFGSWDRYVMTSGIVQNGAHYAAIPNDSLRREGMKQRELLFYDEGLTATISVEKTPAGEL